MGQEPVLDAALQRKTQSWMSRQLRSRSYKYLLILMRSDLSISLLPGYLLKRS